LTNLSCKSNKQGIAVSTAATAQFNNVTLSDTGIVTNNGKYQVYCNAIYLDGDGTTASIAGSTISGDQYNGIFIANGAKISVQTVPSAIAGYTAWYSAQTKALQVMDL
jgi:hypothetical protein